MFKTKKASKSQKRLRRRTSLEIEEEQSRTLYIRLPHTIKDKAEIKNLFFGDFRVKVPRQNTRYCHVIFNDLEEKIKNLKAIKGKLIDGKPIYAGPPKPLNLEKKKKPKQKKIVVPQPKDDPKLSKYLFISNIPPGVKASEVKDAFPGSKTVALLKGLVKGKKQAKLKMSSAQLCLHYANNKSNWPILKEQKLRVSLAKSNSKNKNKKQKKTESLKIYDGESEHKEQSEVKDGDSKKVDEAESDEDEDDEEEENEKVEEDEEEDEEEEDEDDDDDDEDDDEDEDEDEEKEESASE